jgi:hypothetical protein
MLPWQKLRCKYAQGAVNFVNPSLCDKPWLYYNGRLYCTRLTTSCCTVYVVTFYAKRNVHTTCNYNLAEYGRL